MGERSGKVDYDQLSSGPENMTVAFYCSYRNRYSDFMSFSPGPFRGGIAGF